MAGELRPPSAAADSNTVDASTFTANLVSFGRILARVGLQADPQRTRLFARVLNEIGVRRRCDVRAAGRAIFTNRREDRSIYDAAFDQYWRRSTVDGLPADSLPRLRQIAHRRDESELVEKITESTAVRPKADTQAPVGASRHEELRRIDFAEFTPSEAKDAEALLSTLRPRLPRRPARRPRVDRSGLRLATRTMLRKSLASGGEPVFWRWLRPTTRLRPIVLVSDISGSMERYTRFMLRFAHALSRCGAPLEVFVFGTRLTRITRELRVRKPDIALDNVAHKVVDWSGGTRIGDSLRQLNLRWVRRTIRSGAIVLLVSDGWERGDPAVLAREMATLQRSCHQLVWLDPLASRPGFEPATVGLRAALPYVDAFLPCATIASLEQMAKHLSRISNRQPTVGARRLATAHQR